MILRRIASAIKNQDWFVVFIEIIIVVLGVYIGIYLGDIQEDRKFKQETDIALQALETELRSDLIRLDEIIEVQSNMVATQRHLIDLLKDEPLDENQIGDLLIFIINKNSTFYPNRAAYQTLQASGYLAALPDEDMRLHITRLFEREYVRQDFNSVKYDELGFQFGMEILATYWDRDERRLLPGNPNGHIIIRSAVWPIHEQGTFYLLFITETIRPDIVDALEMIDDYQGEGE